MANAGGARSAPPDTDGSTLSMGGSVINYVVIPLVVGFSFTMGSAVAYAVFESARVRGGSTGEGAVLCLVAV